MGDSTPIDLSSSTFIGSTSSTLNSINATSPLSDGSLIISANSSRSRSSTEDIPPLKIITLRELYETSSFALTVTDCTTYEEDAKKREWLEALKEKMLAI